MKARYVLGGYVEWSVPEDIAHVVEASWTYAFPRGAPALASSPTVHRVLPYTGVSLVLHGDRTTAGCFRPRGLLVQGASESYRFFRPTSDVVMAAVRLGPEWATAVLGTDPTELKNRVLELQDTPGWRSTFRRLRCSAHLREALGALEGLVHDRLGAVHAHGPGLTAHRALEMVRRDPARGRVAGLAKATGVSERTLRRSVTTATGMSPKWIQRVERLTRVVTEADGLRRPPWSDLAFRYGFSDQAHLVREARALTGCTPPRLHRERRAQRHSLDAPERRR